MHKDVSEECRRLVEEEGVPERHLHRFGKRQWPYNQEIARLAGEVSSRESIKF